MVEDFVRFAMRRKEVCLMKVVPTMLHAGFISHKTFESICRSFEVMVLNIDQKLTEQECHVVRVCCLESA